MNTSVSSPLHIAPRLPRSVTQPEEASPHASLVSPTPLTAETPEASGDKALTKLYADTLLKCAQAEPIEDPHHSIIDTIPPTSTFGQWRTHLHNLLKSPQMLSWAKEKNIDLSKGLMINADPGNIVVSVAGKTQSINYHDFIGWPLLMSAVKALAPSGGLVRVGAQNTASAQDVARFYGEVIPSDFRVNSPDYKKRLTQRAEHLLHVQTLMPARSVNDVGQDLSHEKSRLGDLNNQTAFHAAIGFLPDKTDEQRQKPFTPANQEIFKSITFQVDPASSYYRQHTLKPGATVSLYQFMVDQGMRLPQNFDELMNLAQAMQAVPLPTFPHGNWGGALSWPVPLSNQDQRKLHSRSVTFLEWTPDSNILGYLTRNRHWGTDTINRFPHQVISEILQSDKAQKMGADTQKAFDGISTPESINEWVLAQIHASLDKESIFTRPPASTRTKVAGFDLASSSHWSQHPSAIRKALADHLISQKKVTVEMAPIAVHLLLSRKAPELLVKDIPAQVTYGSHTWVTFTTAVARIEAQTPGASAYMTFAQVMQWADMAPLTVEDRLTEQAAQSTALKDWGVVSGLMTPNSRDEYTEDQMSAVRTGFSKQVAELSAASKTLATPIPELPERARAALKKVYGDLPFDDKCITFTPAGRDEPGPYSISDIYRNGMLKHPLRGMVSSNSAIDVSLISKHVYGLPSIDDVEAEFKRDLSLYFDNYEAAVSAATKNLLSKLPLQDRKFIENGKVTLIKEILLETNNFGGTTEKRSVPNCLNIKCEWAGETRIYSLNLSTNSIQLRQTTRPYDLRPKPTEFRAGTAGIHLEQVIPDGKYSPTIALAKENTGVPDSYFSERSNYIADALIKDIAIRTAADSAKGATTFETEVPTYKKGREFLLNLIPFRSAIRNFQQGNIGEGVGDLALDALGFLIGLGAAAKGAKALRAGASAGQHFSRGVSIIGRATIGALNPLDGVFALGGALGKGLKTVFLKGRTGVRTLTGAATKYDVIEAFKRFDAGSIGTVKVQGAIIEGAGVMRNGKWYLLNTLTHKPYGIPRPDFLPSARVDFEELGKWETAIKAQSPESKRIQKEWRELIHNTKNGPNKALFENGYNGGLPTDIVGYSAKMKAEDVMKLAISNKSLTAQELGILARHRERLAVQHGLRSANRFSENVSSVGGTLTPLPQIFYLSQVNPLSGGQCAALSRVMANAMEEGKELKFMGNLFEAAANPTAPAARKFISALSDVQKQVTSRVMFHGAQPTRQISQGAIVTELSNTTGNKTLMMSTPGHAMMAGVAGEGANRTYFFYDPNFGIATFSNPEMMRRGLDKIFNDKKLPIQYTTYSSNTNSLEFKVSVHDNSWISTASVNRKSIADLYDKSLFPPKNKLPPESVPANAAAVAPAKPESVFVPEYDSATVLDTSTVLTTRGISDCTAVVMLSDLKDGIYHKRTLMHLRGSSLNELQSKALRDAQASFADGGAKLIVVGGDNTWRPYGIASVLKQEQNGETLLRNLVTQHPNSVTITTASGIDVKPNGTFELIEGNRPVSEFSQSQKREVFDFID